MDKDKEEKRIVKGVCRECGAELVNLEMPDIGITVSDYVSRDGRCFKCRFGRKKDE